MWNDIVKANCARARTIASQPSNITHHPSSPSGVDPTTPDLTIVPAVGGPVSRRRHHRRAPKTERPGWGASRPGRWRLLGRLELEKLSQRALPVVITQTSAALLALQSTTCSRTNIEPVSRWARGAMFWLDSE